MLQLCHEYREGVCVPIRFVLMLRSQCKYYTAVNTSLDKEVQVKDTRVSELQGEHCTQAKILVFQPRKQSN